MYKVTLHDLSMRSTFRFQYFLNILNIFHRNCLWRQAPKNALEDEMYNLQWFQMTDAERVEAVKNKNCSFSLFPDKRVVFDAADFSRMGKHIFGLIGTTTNLQGIETSYSIFKVPVCDQSTTKNVETRENAN